MPCAHARSFANSIVSSELVLVSAVLKLCVITDSTFGLVSMSHINNQQLFLPLTVARLPKV